jgi:hypothetical protein
MDSHHILPLKPRSFTPETRQIAAPAVTPPAKGYLDVDGWTVQVIGDAVFITCAGEVMTQTRTGELNRKEIVVRREPPVASNNSRPTEMVRK